MMMAALTGRPPNPSRFDRTPTETVEQRLRHEFRDLAPEAVRRCVADVNACVIHLGMEAAPALVEAIAREHLVGMVKSDPPSGRGPARP